MNILSNFIILSYYAGISLLIYAAIHDLIARTIPNWTNLSIAILALPLRISQGNLKAALFFSIVVLLLLLLLWRLRFLGGGDVKLWAAATLLVPPSWQTEFLVLDHVTLIGGLLALIYIMQRRLLKYCVVTFQSCQNQRLWQRTIRAELWRIRRGGSLPYAVAISAGLMVTLWPHLNKIVWLSK